MKNKEPNLKWWQMRFFNPELYDNDYEEEEEEDEEDEENDITDYSI